MGTRPRPSILLPSLCAGVVLLAGGLWAIQLYFTNVQIPKFHLELIRTSEGHADGSAKATAINAAARIWLQSLQHSADPAIDWFSVYWVEYRTEFPYFRHIYLEGHSRIDDGTLFFTPNQPVDRKVYLSVSAEGMQGEHTFNYLLEESSTSPDSTPPGGHAIWMPVVTSVPANALKFYVAFSQPMTEGGIYEHLKLEQKTEGSWLPVEGAFRESELWTPDLRRLTVWLHPGRQKDGVNLNEEEGPVLVAGRQYRLVLSGEATTQEGKHLNQDILLSFTATEPDHHQLTPQQWTLQTATPRSVRLLFHKPLDWAMLASAFQVDGKPAEVQIDEDARAITVLTPAPWTSGKHVLDINPNLEDMAGNNLLRPFEVDVSGPSEAPAPGLLQMEFEASP